MLGLGLGYEWSGGTFNEEMIIGEREGERGKGGGGVWGRSSFATQRPEDGLESENGPCSETKKEKFLAE